jgi:cysteine-rich repeat protein
MTAYGKCIEICGDGVVVFAGCDDGNQISGDGCSSNCTIEKGYVCELIKQESYCWRKDTRIEWQIIPTFGANQFTLLL